MDDQEIRNRIVEKMLRNRVIGSHKISIDTAVNRYLPVHQEGRGRHVIAELLSDPDSPVEGYGGGHRQNIRLQSVDAAVAYLESNGGNVPFGFD